MLFNAHISNCSLQLERDVHIIQVDLNPLSKKHLNQGMENLRKLWERFTYTDQSTPMSDKPVQQYKLDIKSLSKIKCFLTFHFFMVGRTTEAIFIVLLEQLSDTTQLTAHRHSLTEIK
ncbi:hypothetical protein [Commensalibacter oyaizuii]|uniref:Uncharacterized protein n=1 Tax=Commensalibacter oyaizuii TaxID=3043873 RepID=A0ABT6Q4I4_9PROT|nr:hypothetical protein [Commensalibacter sp. TBRC 16381]MDI2091409.1 hypothetical protein [Commensalibacter sp. TBRC 16381]